MIYEFTSNHHYKYTKKIFKKINNNGKNIYIFVSLYKKIKKND